MKWLLLLSWVLLSSVLRVPKGKGTFGVCVSYQATGKITTYIAYLNDGGRLSSRKTILEDEFVKFASGFWPSIYNPTRENIFEKEGLFCKVIVDETTKKQYPICAPMDSLWKLRFATYPFTGIIADGWSGKNYRPSSEQEQFLHKEFGIYNIDHDFFVDTSFWKIMRSVNDPEWINLYKNLP